MPVLLPRRLLAMSLLPASLLLTACGGGSGSSTSQSPSPRPIADANSVTGAEMRETNVQSIEEYLNGRVAGLQAVRDEAGRLTLRIRGNASVESEPLLIIEGMPVVQGGNSDALRALNPRDILRVEVLKDASQTAMYGSRGANGVVIIRLRKR